MDESVTPLPLTLSQRITITDREGGVEGSCSGLWSCMVHSGVFPYPDCYRLSHPPSNTPLLLDCQLSTDTGGSLQDAYRRCVEASLLQPFFITGNQTIHLSTYNILTNTSNQLPLSLPSSMDTNEGELLFYHIQLLIN